MKTRTKLFAVSVALLFLFSFMGGTQGKGAVQTADIELSSTTATVGFSLSVYCSGLTDGTVYAVVAVHSAGNVTAVTSGSGTSDYVSLLFTSADSDGIVPVIISEATAAYAGGSDIATVLLTLKAPSIPGSQFFTGIIGPLVIVAVVVGLAGIFAYKRFRK